MNEEERQAHYHLISKCMQMPFCRHVIVSLDRRNEWHRVRLKLTVVQRLLPHLLFAAFVLFFTANESLGHRVTIVIVVGALIEFVFWAISRGNARDVVIEFDVSADVLRAPLAGLEIQSSHFTGFALQVVRHKVRTRGNLLRHANDYCCFYVRMADGSLLPLIADSAQQTKASGFHTAARKLAEGTGLPLMEPEHQHKPTPINP